MMPPVPEPRSPADFPRRVLLASLGLAPQVLTETLYCLAQASPPFVPTEIHVVTTLEGRHRAMLTLLDESTAMLSALEADIRIAGLRAALTPERIHVIVDVAGTPLADIDSEADNAATADLIVRLVREFTADQECALHASIAGGRKTMGFLLGYTLSLFGRPQDRLSHVLVSEPFQAHPQFFFPPRMPRVLLDRNQRPVSTAEAQLTLAEIPVVRLRDGLPRGFLTADWRYSDIVAAAQSAMSQPVIKIDVPAGRLFCGGIAVPLKPVTFAVAAWMAARTARLGPEDGAIRWSTCDWTEFLDIYSRLPDQQPARVVRLRQRLKEPAGEEEFLREHVSRLKRALRETLGPDSTPYEPRPFGRKPSTRVGFALLPGAITVKLA